MGLHAEQVMTLNMMLDFAIENSAACPIGASSCAHGCRLVLPIYAFATLDNYGWGTRGVNHKQATHVTDSSKPAYVVRCSPLLI